MVGLDSFLFFFFPPFKRVATPFLLSLQKDFSYNDLVEKVLKHQCKSWSGINEVDYSNVL